MKNIGRALAVVGSLMIVPAGAAQDAEKTSGAVKGRVTLDLPGVTLAAMGPTVAYLDAVEGTLKFEVRVEKPRMSQKDAKFNPSFLVVSTGQTVEMPNNDRIVHNVFSYSKPNEFDLGLYPKGESKSVTFKGTGAVDLYCSIHASMRAVIFVAPSPYHATVDASGAFEIRGVPPGRYALKTWNRKLPETVAVVEVTAGQVAEAALGIRAGK